MIKGYLAMKGVHVAETRIGSMLRTMHQPYHEARRQVCTVSALIFYIIKLVKNLNYELMCFLDACLAAVT